MFSTILQSLALLFKSADDKAAHYAKHEVRAVVRAMVYQAQKSGELSQSDIALIQSLFTDYSGLHIDADTLAAVARHVSSSRYSFTNDMRGTQSQVSYDVKLAILELVYLVGLADGAEVNMDRLHEIAQALHVPDYDVLPIVKQTKQTLQQA